jgi:hypothetical protein
VAQPSPYVIDFPTLFVAGDWVTAHCIVPDGFMKGDPFKLVDWQLWSLLNFYRVRPEARVGQLAPAFHYRRSQIVLPQKAGKAPYTAGHVCVEAVGPALFAGWAEGGETWDCRDYGCGCGWSYEYQPDEAMGMPWPTPLIQITATSEEQTDNIYDALRPMIDDGPLHDLIPKTGEEFIRLPNKGRIDVVTSSARSRLGQRITFCPQDETGIWTEQGGMIRVAETQRRGLAGMGGRSEETTNAWDPAEHSVAQRTAESKRPDIFRHHPEAPASLSYTNKAERRKIHRRVYEGGPWVDLDAIEAEAAELLETDPTQAERFFGNRAVAGGGKAFDIEVFKTLYADHGIDAGRKVTLGFDGSLFFDATGLVATDVESGHQVVVAAWERPPHLSDEEDWEVPIAELDEAVDFAFTFWTVWRMYADPPHYREDLSRWAGMYGADRVVEWWTNRKQAMGYALKEYRTAMRTIASPDGEPRPALSHGPLDSTPEARAMHTMFMEHIGNAIRRPTKIRDEDVAESDDGESRKRARFLWVIGKESQKSKLRIDLAMCGCLSWRARQDAIRAGVLNEEPEADYSYASW